MRRPLTALWALLVLLPAHAQSPPWSDAERAMIGSLSLSRLVAPPPNPSNRYADDPRAADIGRALFSDTRLSSTGTLACASCHHAARAFTDGLALSQGQHRLRRNAPSLLTAAWHRWQFWDGRADSLWMQALGPMLGADELGATPAQARQLLQSHYRDAYEPVFGALAGHDALRAAVNAGKALEAFERTLRPRPARFDTWADAVARGSDSTLLTPPEQAGARLFVGKAQCLRCHHGPLLTNEAFQNTGMGRNAQLPSDPGRARGARELQESAFNCRGAYSDDAKRACPHLDYLRATGRELLGAFKVPSLREVAVTAPYMHDGRFDSLAAVLDHYNRAPNVHESAGHTELFPLHLDAGELAALEAFLSTLSAQ